jgi:protoporphyrinogen oxidase
MKEKVLIIGAGPAGLTAAYELSLDDKYDITILEASDEIGGISRTILYNGNRIDIGGHRFFSKSDRVMNWWQNILPIQGSLAKDYKQTKTITEVSTLENAPDPDIEDKVLLIRNRLSRILFLRKFFDYPISLSLKTVKNLGIIRIVKIGMSYIYRTFFPLKDESTLENFFINRFGNELYKTFFKDYTQKVWGVPCDKISSQWGAQRIKGLSITKTIIHALKKNFKSKENINQKNIETTLIEKFFYPKFGPGQLWEEVLNICLSNGVKIEKLSLVDKLIIEDNQIKKLFTASKEYESNHIISTMPIKDLINSIEDKKLNNKVKSIAQNLVYRDFITVGILLEKLKINNDTNFKTINNIIPDNWIYIQESDVKVGRIQVFNNWSPYMIENPDKIWIGLEYFCNVGDEIWNLSKDELKEFAINELVKIDLIDKKDVIDSTVIKVEKAYPAYFGSYDNFDEIKKYINTIKNLYCVGRNGMHRYNNMDHSMLSAMEAVKNIQNNIKSKDNIWSVNTEEEYHESK